jgi:hypothetical protein
MSDTVSTTQSRLCTCVNGPWDGLKLHVDRPFIYLPTNPGHLCVYLEAKGSTKAEYELYGDDYLFRGYKPEQPTTVKG